MKWIQINKIPVYFNLFNNIIPIINQQFALDLFQEVGIYFFQSFYYLLLRRYSCERTSTNLFLISLELHKNWKLPRKRVCVVLKQIDRKILWVCMIIRVSKRLLVRLIRKTKNPWMYEMDSLTFMSGVGGGGGCQSTYNRVCISLDQTFEYIW